MRESRTLGSVRAKAEWLRYSTISSDHAAKRMRVHSCAPWRKSGEDGTPLAWMPSESLYFSIFRW